MGRKSGYVTNTDPVNQPRKHSAYKILAELGIEKAKDGKPIGAETSRVYRAMNDAGYVWSVEDQEWQKGEVKRREAPEDRFWRQVDKRGPDECWEWQGDKMLHPFNKTPTYGKFVIRGYKTSAHRFSWMLHFGEIPKGMCVLHRCDNPPCANPNHLFLGTHHENMRDKVIKGRANGGGMKGERNPEHILKVEQVKEIIQLLKSGTSRKSIAIEYGVAYSTITCIAQGRTWKSIPRD